MKERLMQLLFAVLMVLFFVGCAPKMESKLVQLFPENNATQVNSDVQLKITLKSKPVIGKCGTIKVFDYDTDTLVDLLDLSIPAGPTKPQPKNPSADYTPEPYLYTSENFTNANTKPGTPSGLALPTPDTFQLTIIGRFTDGFHFYPIIVNENTATIYLHNNLLQYNKRYYVTIDSGVLVTKPNEFFGFAQKGDWSFTIKEHAPDLNKGKLIVDSKGTGDFNTVQGAMDFIPDYSEKPITVFVKNGVYEELVYFRNKKNVTIEGESGDGVLIQYSNNEVFNPHPSNIKTNEWPGTFPSRRAAFAMDNCSNMILKNLTVKTLLKGQAEGLLINGSENVVYNVHIVGDGDALQTNGSAYFEKVLINGGGDMVLGRGPAFFKDCDFYSPGPFMWIRNTKANHGNVFVDCSFIGTADYGAEIARAPTNNGFSYPYCEAVLLNCKLENIAERGWGPVGGKTENVHYWELNSTSTTDGKPIDVSKRSAVSKQLNAEGDAEIIQQYQTPAFVFGGWNPVVE